MPDGVNFALYSQNADAVFLLFFDRPDGEPTDIIQLRHRQKYIWHAFVPGVTAGQLYAYKVRGEFNPARGLRFNEHKLLLDPYAKAFTGKLRNTQNLLLSYDPDSPDRDLSLDRRDNTDVVPKCIVVDEDFDWQGDSPPSIPLEELIIYEVHLKGFTAHASSSVRFPGTYLGVIDKIPYLTKLGVNALEFLPVHEHCVEDFLVGRGLTNYWGYNTIGFFAPESSYGTERVLGCQVAEFQTLVRELHRAGIEVILDAVYNHTAEGNELGPTVCFRGIDNPTYYSLAGGPSEPLRYYMNDTGCGNSLNLAHPHVIRFVMDSLRYWVEIMHVDGFRFDLASVLGRQGGVFEKTASFFDAVSQDPILSRVKLIAEPWDLGTYQVGNFPVDWSEWNGRFRDTVRKFGKGDGGQVPELGWRLTGSADLYADDGRSAYNSVNFITCHDGLTLADLVSYNDKHNDANQERNRDGTNDNNSWNCGAEGPTDDPGITRLRKQQIKNFACSLLFAAGTPMILGGDEFMRTQGGNNNAYCQDNEISWFDWQDADRNRDMLVFFQKAIGLCRRFPVLQSRKFFTGQDQNNNGIPDIQWFGPDGGEPAWQDPDLRTLCYQLDGGEVGDGGRDYVLFIVFNADYRLRAIQVPPPPGKTWYRVVDTSLNTGEDILGDGKEVPIEPSGCYLANPRSTIVLVGK
jgi:glycogen operon protein